MLVTAKVRGGPMEQQQGEALEVVVGGTGGDGEPWHAGQYSQDILCVGSKLTQQLKVLISNRRQDHISQP